MFVFAFLFFVFRNFLAWCKDIAGFGVFLYFMCFNVLRAVCCVVFAARTKSKYFDISISCYCPFFSVP